MNPKQQEAERILQEIKNCKGNVWEPDFVHEQQIKIIAAALEKARREGFREGVEKAISESIDYFESDIDRCSWDFNFIKNILRQIQKELLAEHQKGKDAPPA